jgi:polyhydroxyalkanoate synthesis repressor PhaR
VSEKRVIKKYPNRRLYDTTESKYITLDDVRKLVLEDVDFTVIDKKSGDDITRSILLQIILEQEDGGEPIFTTDMLQHLISFYGNSVQRLATDFLDRSVGMIKEQQDVIQSQLSRTMMGSDAMKPLTDLTQRNMELWQKMQEDFFRAAGSMGSIPGIPGMPGTSRRKPEEKTPEDEDEGV